jgi:uncharacterized protein YjbJ (UPF0337 family)
MNFALKNAIPEPDQGSRQRPEASSQRERGATWVTRCRSAEDPELLGSAGFGSDQRLEVTMVDKDRIKGSAEQAKGKVKEIAGKVTGDSKLEGEGKADQVKGKVQNTIGGIKDTLRGK